MLVAITGGIGCGKSVVSQLLRVMGYNVYDCDSHAKKLMCTDEDLRKDLIELFGAQTYLSNGELNKKHISGCIFGNPQALKKMNAAIHPAVARDLLSYYNAAKEEELFFYESAILFESGFNKLAVPDYIISVTTPLSVRIERVKKRDLCSDKAVISRINSQMPQEEKDRMATFVVYNDDQHSIIEQIDEILKRI